MWHIHCSNEKTLLIANRLPNESWTTQLTINRPKGSNKVEQDKQQELLNDMKYTTEDDEGNYVQGNSVYDKYGEYIKEVDEK